MKPIVKIVLFIGLLLLIIATCSYGYLTYKEGFQASPTDLAGFCSTNDNVCTPVCYNKSTLYNPNPNPGNPNPMNPDANALVPETPSEKDLYDTYTYYNLQDINTGLPLQTTSFTAIDMGGVLGAFDPYIPIPWDYDNMSLDPQYVLWGTIDTAVSTALFDTAYTRATMGSANSADFIQSDPTTGRDTYTSTLFGGKTVPNGPKAQGLQALEGIVSMGIMVGTGHIMGSIMAPFSKEALDRHQSILNEVKAAKARGVPITFDDAARNMDNTAAEKTAAIRDQLRNDHATQLNNIKNPDGSYKYRNPEGGLNEAGLKNLAAKEDSFIVQAIDYPTGKPPSAFQRIKGGVNTLKAQLGFKPSSLDKLESAAKIKVPLHIGPPINTESVKAAKWAEKSLAGKIVGGPGKLAGKASKAFEGITKPISNLSNQISKKLVGNSLKSKSALLAKRFFGKLLAVLGPMAFIKSLCVAFVARAAISAARATQESITAAALAGNPFTAAAAVAMTAKATQDVVDAEDKAKKGWLCWIISTILDLFEISCYTWIPIVLGSVHDPSNTICPGTHTWNMERAVLTAPGGEIAWAIISGIPDIGALISAFAPYVCWYSGELDEHGKPNGVFDMMNFLSSPAIIIETIHPPTYYYDSTLSIFTTEKVYGAVPNPDDPTKEVICNGMSSSDPAYYEPALYKDPNGNYPIWVDYANQVMLDKMAQFYHDFSRTAMTVNIDGTATYEYISKFYGVISSTEFSCDTQCEISEITVDTVTGVKLCERIVDPTPGGECTWHDRRFYWYIDISGGIAPDGSDRGVPLGSPDLDQCANCYTLINNTLDVHGKPAPITNTDCIAILGTNTIYNNTGEPIPDRVTIAQMACATKYLMEGGCGNTSTAKISIMESTNTTAKISIMKSINKEESCMRKNWDPAFRMLDNMKKFFITGCTHIDGTAPVAADVSNTEAAGTPAGNSIVALGSPSVIVSGNYVSGSDYYPPVIGEVFPPLCVAASDPKHLPECDPSKCNVNTGGPYTCCCPPPYPNSTQVPTDNSCAATESAFMKFGTTVSATAIAQQNAAAAVPNPIYVPNLYKSHLKSDWVFGLTKNDGKQSSYVSPVYDGTTKSTRMIWTGCADGHGGAACVLNSHKYDIIYGSITGGIGMGKLGFVPGIGPLLQPIGLFVIPSVNAFTGIDSYLSCLSQGSVAQTGTFILNGMLVTSESSPEGVSFVLYQGPIMPFAPGYTPKIKFDKMIPNLKLIDCVNRYTVRYFVKTFRQQYIDFNLTKILNITPRRTIRSTPPNPATDNPLPCCVFAVEYTNSTGTAIHDQFALEMTLQGYYKGSPMVVHIDTTTCDDGAVPIVCANDPVCNSETTMNKADLICKNNINTYLYQPSATITQNIPPPVPFSTTSKDYAFIPSAPAYGPNTLPSTVSSQLISPDTMCGPLDCSNFALQTHLFEQFNVNHLGVTVDFDTNSAGTAYTSVLQAYTPNSILDNGIQSCIYNLNLYIATPSEYAKTRNMYAEQPSSGSSAGAIIVNSATPPLTDVVYKPTIVKMYLASIINPTPATQCIYDLEYDDYATNLWYQPVPATYFEIPPADIPINPNFSSQTGCPVAESGSGSGSNAPTVLPTPNNCGTHKCYIDCSGAALMQNLVTQFNQTHTTTKIGSITRAWTSSSNPTNTNDPNTNPPICDYDVEMMRTSGSITIASKETVRFHLKPTVPISCGTDVAHPAKSGFDLLSDDSDTPNSGKGLNNTTTIGLLATPFIWSGSFIHTVNTLLNGYILDMIGLDGPKKVNAISKTALTAMNTIMEAATLTQSLTVCPIAPCNDAYILQKILNRFNFDNYPKYPTEQYGAQKTYIRQFRKAGISSPTQCQVELIEETRTYDDFLYEKQNSTRDYLRQWAFDLVGIPTAGCKFTVKDLSGDDLTKGVMNVGANPYALMSEYSVVDPGLTLARADNPVSRASAGSAGSSMQIPIFTYTEPTVDCMNPTLLAKIKSMYDAVQVQTNKDSNMGRVNKYNTLKTILQSFNPVPNVCEYKAQAIHTYYDQDYGWYYTVPVSAPPISFDEEDYTYIVATWAPGTDYDVETGTLLKNTPTVAEFHIPDLTLRGGEFYRPDGTGPVTLPYIAGVGNDPNTVDTSTPRFKSTSYTL